MLRFLFLVTITWCSLAANAFTGDWRQFRGSESNGLGDDILPPTTFSATENVAWKVALPGKGLSSPIIVGDRVFVTCSSGFNQDRLHVVCFAVKDGVKLWERQFSATGRTSHYPTTSIATSTPASDGQRIFALYSSNDLACLDLDGNLQWYRGLTYDHRNASNSLGMASSPIVVDQTLVTQIENDSESLATGIDVATGISRWTSVRPKKANWSSALVWPRRFGGGEDLALLQSSEGISAIRPLTGEVAWKYTDGASTIPSSVVADGTLYAVSHGITALRPPTESANIEQLWRASKLGPGTASPLVYQGRLYAINSAGVLLAADLKTGQTKWQLRIGGPFSGSPIAAGGHLFVFNEKGEGHCVKLGEEAGELVSTGDLAGERFLCTPAISNGALYVRSDATLWKIAEKP
ncbi:outer membrane protein assembly factor BamB family protein [Schlesneria paludicola]|uniref:outer membrane protein assembly factor BamB family protein n=1 Tax=Schlesneria paludicola TaxID=360056 RepID=UPI00029A67C6|nr:PQQ-binding-like beta-propeller repeat protein [Schlesneria paludicola]